jgi:hypothetical protein
MDDHDSINNLILDLSLASTLPIGVHGRDFIRATASANALMCRTKEMQPRELRELEYSIGPLLSMLANDIEDPVAAKCASGIRYLMPSRICMSQLLSQDGLFVIARVLDELLSSNSTVDLKCASVGREIVEHLSVCYREIGRFYPWEIVKVGALRHSIVLLRFGDEVLKTSAAGTLAVLSTDLNICKQMFVNGAIKPLLNVSDGGEGNAACVLAGLGCIVQMCNIPEIGSKVVSQGAMPVLEKALHRSAGFSIAAIREKALYALAWLSRIPDVQDKIGTLVILRGMKRELVSGTMPSRYTVVQLLLNIHGKYPLEPKFVPKILDALIMLLHVGPWHARNLVIKAVCVLYHENDMKMYLAQNNVIEYTIALVKSKPADLQEAPLVMFLSFCTHRDIPLLMMQKGVIEVVSEILCNAIEEIIRELAVIVLKALMLYSVDRVESAVPENKLHLLRRDADIPTLYGSEYGGLIEEYLQQIVENRRDMHYLLESMTAAQISDLSISEQLLQSYQTTFMELDMNCIGTLGIDELKMLVVLMGEELDKDELKDLLDEYGTHKKGRLDFSEFIAMMASWNTRFGTGAQKIINTAVKRGAIGRARRDFNQWYNQRDIDKKQIDEMKARRKNEKAELSELALKYMPHVALRAERAKVAKSRIRRTYDDDY